MFPIIVYDGTNKETATVHPWYAVSNVLGERFPAAWHAPQPVVFRSSDPGDLVAQARDYIADAPAAGIKVLAVGEAVAGPANYLLLTLMVQRRVRKETP